MLLYIYLIYFWSRPIISSLSERKQCPLGGDDYKSIKSNSCICPTPFSHNINSVPALNIPSCIYHYIYGIASVGLWNCAKQREIFHEDIKSIEKEAVIINVIILYTPYTKTGRKMNWSLSRHIGLECQGFMMMCVY